MKVQNLYFAAVLATLTAIQTQAQNTLEKLWETEAQLPVPESVLYSAKEKVLFVAQIDGKPAEKDGVGAIGKVGLDGKIINANWVSGLHAPKGMGIYKSTLYVSDVTDIVEIDLKSGKIIKKHAVEGAKFLNDLTVDSKGNVYVSDSQTKRVNLLKNGVVSI
jgi:sugar lactone lactonase YvrE